MDSSLVIFASLMAPLVILSSVTILICAFILLRQKPVVLDNRVLVWILAVAVLSINAGIIYLMITTSETAVISNGVFLMLIQAVVYAAGLRAMRGVFIFSVSAEACRTALREVLLKLGLQTAETILGFNFVEQSGRLLGGDCAAAEYRAVEAGGCGGYDNPQRDCEWVKDLFSNESRRFFPAICTDLWR
ncbi:MAG TPA: hypothetical protein VN364_07265 [Bellilinea sp.]|nr:hypothetical protein [Bellilinea sp.]